MSKVDKAFDKVVEWWDNQTFAILQHMFADKRGISSIFASEKLKKFFFQKGYKSARIDTLKGIQWKIPRRKTLMSYVELNEYIDAELKKAEDY